MKRKRFWPRVASVACVVALVVLLRGCSPAVDPWKEAPGEPRVLASFPPIYCFAKNVAGEGPGVLCLITSTDPHEYQDPTTADILTVRKANVFFVNGLGLDDVVADKLRNNAGNARLQVVRLADALPEKLRRKLGEHEGHGHAHGNQAHHHEGNLDPHAWLGIPQAKIMVEKVRDELKTLDPSRAKQYDDQAANYLARLDKLLADGKAQLAGKHLHVIAMHDSMGYFADAFGFEVVDTLQPSPNVEPDAKRMQELVKKATEEKVRAVCYEPSKSGVSKKAAESLRDTLKGRGLTVTLVEFDPLETAEPGALNAGWYEERMRSNIANLTGAAK